MDISEIRVRGIAGFWIRRSLQSSPQATAETAIRRADRGLQIGLRLFEAVAEQVIASFRVFGRALANHGMVSAGAVQLIFGHSVDTL